MLHQFCINKGDRSQCWGFIRWYRVIKVNSINWMVIYQPNIYFRSSCWKEKSTYIWSFGYFQINLSKFCLCLHFELFPPQTCIFHKLTNSDPIFSLLFEVNSQKNHSWTLQMELNLMFIISKLFDIFRFGFKKVIFPSILRQALLTLWN